MNYWKKNDCINRKHCLFHVLVFYVEFFFNIWLYMEPIKSKFIGSDSCFKCWSFKDSLTSSIFYRRDYYSYFFSIHQTIDEIDWRVFPCFKNPMLTLRFIILHQFIKLNSKLFLLHPILQLLNFENLSSKQNTSSLPGFITKSLISKF
jgi:hypothetical protein